MNNSKQINAEIAARLKAEGFVQAGRGKSSYFKIIETDDLNARRELKISFSTTKGKTEFECVEECGLHTPQINKATVQTLGGCFAFFDRNTPDADEDEEVEAFLRSMLEDDSDDETTPIPSAYDYSGKRTFLSSADDQVEIKDNDRKGFLIVGKQGSGKSTYARDLKSNLVVLKTSDLLHLNGDSDPHSAVKLAESVIQKRFGPEYVILELMSEHRHLVNAKLWDIKDLDEDAMVGHADIDQPVEPKKPEPKASKEQTINKIDLTDRVNRIVTGMFATVTSVVMAAWISLYVVWFLAFAFLIGTGNPDLKAVLWRIRADMGQDGFLGLIVAIFCVYFISKLWSTVVDGWTALLNKEGK